MISILIPNRNEEKIHALIEQIEKWIPGSQAIISVDRDSRGKGWAIRTALQHAKHDIICFIDGDMDIHPRMILRLVPFLQDYDIVVGKKQIRGLLSRRLLTFLSRLYILIFFDLNYDTQTGIKLFRRSAIPSWESDSFAFDVEILSKAYKNGKSIIEIPVEATIEKRMNTKSILKAFWESLKIWINT